MNKLIAVMTASHSVCTDLGLLVLRLFFGLSLAVMHGWGKLPVTEEFVSGVESMGLPMPAFFAWAAALSEFAGGLLLAVGLLTRPAALAVLVTMAVAAFVAHAADPYQVKELAFAYGTVALAFVFAGAGRWSLDALLCSRSTPAVDRAT